MTAQTASKPTPTRAEVIHREGGWTVHRTESGRFILEGSCGVLYRAVRPGVVSCEWTAAELAAIGVCCEAANGVPG